ncbi:MAG: sugar kinase [Bacteroidetes bacterium]|nr:sugar kinase [Bacteroidota bacterium]MBU2585769.1 sugar kinase [Bacteroidota bacterium]
MSLLVVGSLGLDDIETPFAKVEYAVGGSAVYISLAASYFSPVTNLVGVVGDDFPSKYLKMMKERNIDLVGLQIVEGDKTFRWSGKYSYDMNHRDTLFTELNVFKDFNPIIPENYLSSRFVMLGNIDPVLQLGVLKQIKNQKLVVCDTMNYWIERKNKELRETLKYIDILIINDSEARMLSGEPNLIYAGKKILQMGPTKLIIKKGEHGCLLITDEIMFSAPAYPLENIFDPTGAGDSFAGGFLGYLSKNDSFDNDTIKRAVIYGSVMASFCVEKFSVEGLLDLNYLKINDRFLQFFSLTQFEES